MEIPKDYLDTNKATWNQKVDYHVDSEFYNMEAFLNGQSTLNDIELRLLGDITGKKILHLQCHFGQDTISLSKMGAQVTGMDLSDKAIAKARELATQLNTNTTFVCSDVYDLPNQLQGQFDIVFTSYGTIGWLPDLDKWAKVIQHFLKPGGKFVFVEFHPVVWMFDNHFTKIEYSYFNTETIIETVSGTYADKEAPLKNDSVSWNHPLTEVINSLIKNTLEINTFEEYDYSPYSCFNEVEEFAPNKFRIKHLDNKIPMIYAIVATKK
ncbi:class I SAM-dependent methyltransferase [Flavobacterium cerinum]|uniref:Class I SAM-dependent methyltransferase n=1 Tax=Flavobacterium cerinum TaxID=2502784 RepID=A0ABY5IQ00_9FLAO|nr:class I SAM-dependent methyltransferase [Flavobacterium cerinum]UUC44330.1 class I SAM-dependent methyltransferase [Flavobacterium cerinum]